MSKSRIPLTRGLSGSGSRQPKSLASKQSTNTSKSSNLLHYGFATEKSNSTKAGSKNTKKAVPMMADQENTEKPAKDDVLRGSREDVASPNTNDVITTDRKMSDNVDDKECSSASKASTVPTPAHLNLSEVQLNALSFSLSELADKISPSKNDYFGEDNWETSQRSANVVADRSNSLGRGKSPGDVNGGPHSKSPYSRKTQSEPKTLSRQKSFNKNKPATSKELIPTNEAGSSTNKMEADGKPIEKEVLMFKTASPAHQESIESGYNSSWSTSSISEDFKNGKHSTDVDTDIDMDLKDLNDETLKSETNADEKLNTEDKSVDYEKALQEKISDVENRINSLILGRRNSIDLGCNKAENSSNVNSEETLEETDDITSAATHNEIVKDTNEALTNGLQDKSHEKESNPDLNQNDTDIENSKTLDNSREDDQEWSRKSPFHILKVRKASLDETCATQKPKRPGLVRRRTTLVTFRPPRQTSAFNEVDDSGVLEIDDTGFVQCLTDVRSMKTMLLKLKRELQEADVVSPLARSKPISSRSITNLANGSEPNETSEESWLRRNTYDSSEGMHEKLRRIRTASLSRRKRSSCLEHPCEEQLAAENSTEPPSVEEVKQKNTDEDMKKMKEENDDLKENMKELKQERDTLFMEKEEIEHELEAKNHTIKLLQKQLEVQDNSEEMTFLQRQVATLTHQVRQQQHKITELKYRTSSPSNAPRSTSPTNFNTKKDLVKHDIKNRLRDAFVRHLEESSKSHVLLSKHIEKAEFTIGEAQKGLKSLYNTPTSQNTASKESLTEVGRSSGKSRPSTNLLGTPRTPDQEDRRHSWTTNSIDKIIKTWKETTKSIENLSSQSTNNNKKSSQLPKPRSAQSSPHLAFL